MKRVRQQVYYAHGIGGVEFECVPVPIENEKSDEDGELYYLF